jgi:hypothetical protein
MAWKGRGRGSDKREKKSWQYSREGRGGGRRAVGRGFTNIKLCGKKMWQKNVATIDRVQH